MSDETCPRLLDKLMYIIAIIAIALVAVLAPAMVTACCRQHHHHHWYYSYPGDQVHRGDVYRYGPPENGGYRGGYYGGRYHDDTHYDD